MKKFVVDVCFEAEYIVEANTKEEAMDIAMDKALNHEDGSWTMSCGNY